MFASKDLLFSAEKYNVSRSLRFRSSASAQLTRTPGSASNRKTWTWSGWVKRGVLAAGQGVFCAVGAATDTGSFYLTFFTNDIIRITGQATVFLATTQVFRDPSSWYHIVLAMDTTNATADNRLRLYVNGSEVTNFGTRNNLTLNTDYGINQASVAHYLMSYNTAYCDGYLAEVNFIDGQQLTPTSFGFYDNAGIWQPKGYTGAYGTNGFYLNFSDNSAATATTIGKDYSGNGNNFTPNNISVTAGITYDSMIDSPTNYADGGNGRGNYCVLNGVDRNISTAPTTISNGNLQITNTYSTTNYGAVAGTLGASSGKWYFEGVNTINAGIGNTAALGLTSSTSSAANAVSILGSTLSQFIGAAPSVSANSFVFRTAGYTTSLANNTTLFASYAAGDIVNVAIDLDAGKIWIGKNGAWYNSGDPATGTTPTSTFTNPGGVWRPWVETAANTTNTNIANAIVNFGQRPFSYTIPSGFSVLNTQNLTTPTIPNGAQYMAAVTYTGTGAPQSITASNTNSGNNPNGITFQPDFVWIKSRSTAGSNILQDSPRGATLVLFSDATTAETTFVNGLTSFNTNGFTLGSGSGTNQNTSATTYIAWEWQAGTAPTTNNIAGAGNVPTAGSVKINGSNSTSALAGSIAATRISANTTAGFSVVTYTGNGTLGATVGHGLGVAPSMIIFKDRSNGAINWVVYHIAIGNTTGLALNLTNATFTPSTAYFNNTSPDSSKFTVGNGSTVNTNTENYVAYCFASISGYSDFGSYTGNGSTNGPFIYTGFRPRYVMIKRTDAVGTWLIEDTSRNAYNLTDLSLSCETSAAEATQVTAGGNPIDILSNGFKCRGSGSSSNASAGTFIYAAFAENPFKISRAR